MILTDLYVAAYLKAKGFKLGKVHYPEIEVIGNDEEIDASIQEYNNGGKVNAKLLLKEMHFIKYLSNKNFR